MAISERLAEEVPLHSLEAEMSALGACFYGSRPCDEVLAGSSEADYFRPAHRIIFSAIKGLRDRKSEIDFVTVKADLIKAQALENIGGEAYLIQVAEFVPSPSNASHYAKIVKENAILRFLKDVAGKMGRLVYDDDLSTSEKVAEFQRMGQSAEQCRVSEPAISIQAMAKELLEVESEEGVSTGFRFLDALTTCNGFPIGQTSLIEAYHKAGKTTFSMSSAKRNAETGRSVLFYTLADLSPRQLTRKLVTMTTGISRNPKDFHEEVVYKDALEQIYTSGWKFDFLESRTHGRTIDDVLIAIREKCWEQPRDVVYIDYIQKFRSKPGRIESKTQRLEDASEQLSDLASELKIPIVLGSQITEDRDGEVMSKYARGIEEDAGVVYRIHRKSEDEKNSNRVEVEVAFNRFGEERTIKLGWNKARVMFED